MRLYKVSMYGDFGHASEMSRWTSRKADIPRLKREIVESCSDSTSQPEPSVDTVEFEPTVSGIVDMLNRHADGS